MYSTNLRILHESDLFSGEDCVGVAYGWETIDKDQDGNVTHVGPATQTAKDNALLWSLAPEAIEILERQWYWHEECFGEPRIFCQKYNDVEPPEFPESSMCMDDWLDRAFRTRYRILFDKLSSAMHSEVTQ